MRRGSGHSGSGILRRTSLGPGEPVSPAAASADRLSVTFANETVVVRDEVAEPVEIEVAVNILREMWLKENLYLFPGIFCA